MLQDVPEVKAPERLNRALWCKRRDDAADWVVHGRWAAFVVSFAGVWSTLMQGYRMLPIVAFTRFGLYLLIGIAALLMRRTRTWTAYLLLTLIALSFVLSFLLGTLFVLIIPRLCVVAICVKGAISVFRYIELERVVREQMLDAGAPPTMRG